MLDRRTFVQLAAGAAAAGLAPTQLPASPSPYPHPLPAIWSFGQLLAFSALDGPTDYASGLVARTLDDPFGLEIVFPTSATLRFQIPPGGAVQLTSDSFHIVTPRGVLRGAFPDAFHLLCEGPVAPGNLPPALQSASANSRTLLGARTHFNPSLLASNLDQLIADRQSWLRRQPAPRGGSSAQRLTLAKAISIMKGQFCSPQGLLRHRWTTPDRWPHRDCWLWDSAFHAIGWRHLDLQLARETLLAVFDAQQPDGRIPHQANPLTVSNIIQPPVLALACQLVAGPNPDLAWIETVYPLLCRYLDWDFAHRIAPGAGLAQWHMDDNPLSRCAESGMDNSPRFDPPGAPFAVDFNAFLSMESRILATFAHALGRPADAARWSARNLELNTLINQRLWDDNFGFYFDQPPDGTRRATVLAVSGFLPLLCGAPTPLQARRLAAHLANPRTFATPAPLASAIVTPGMPHPEDMWRGPFWVNTNWLVALGFEQAGNLAAARTLRRQTMRQVERWYLQRGSIFEFYDEHAVTPPDLLPRKGPMQWGSPYHQAVHDYGWSATLYADLAFTTPR
jgi:hypothetical protein